MTDVSYIRIKHWLNDCNCKVRVQEVENCFCRYHCRSQYLDSITELESTCGANGALLLLQCFEFWNILSAFNLGQIKRPWLASSVHGSKLRMCVKQWAYQQISWSHQCDVSYVESEYIFDRRVPTNWNAVNFMIWWSFDEFLRTFVSSNILRLLIMIETWRLAVCFVLCAVCFVFLIIMRTNGSSCGNDSSTVAVLWNFVWFIFYFINFLFYL